MLDLHSLIFERTALAPRPEFNSLRQLLRFANIKDLDTVFGTVAHFLFASWQEPGTEVSQSAGEEMPDKPTELLSYFGEPLTSCSQSR